VKLDTKLIHVEMRKNKKGIKVGCVKEIEGFKYCFNEFLRIMFLINFKRLWVEDKKFKKDEKQIYF
jgi:hypothetical protein